jgi:hypothetical protein
MNRLKAPSRFMGDESTSINEVFCLEIHQRITNVLKELSMSANARTDTR